MPESQMRQEHSKENKGLFMEMAPSLETTGERAFKRPGSPKASRA